MNIHDKFSYFRKNRDLLIKELSAQIKMSRNNLTAIEKGKYIPKLKSIYNFCVAVNIPVDSLFSDADDFLYFELEGYIHLTKESDINKLLSLLNSIKTTDSNISGIEERNVDINELFEEEKVETSDNEIDIKKVFAERLKHYQKQAGLSHYEFTDKIDVSLNFLKEMRAGKKLPSVEKFQKICKVLNVPAYCLLQGLDEALFYENRTLYDNIRKLERKDIVKIISMLDAYNNTLYK